MQLISKNEIEIYLRRFSHNKDIQTLLLHCLFEPLKTHAPNLKKIQSPDDLGEETLKRKFSRHAKPMARFVPDEALDCDVKKVAEWINDFYWMARGNFSGTVRSTANRRLYDLKTMSAVMDRIAFPLMPEEDFRQVFATRQVPKEEKLGHIEHQMDLPARHFLIRILTAQGMNSAGQKANNCLDNRRNKLLVGKPHLALFFSIRDADNNSVVSIVSDILHGKIQFEGNDHEPTPSYVEDMIFQSLDFIRQKYPQTNRPRPYGAQPRL